MDPTAFAPNWLTIIAAILLSAVLLFCLVKLLCWTLRGDGTDSNPQAKQQLARVIDSKADLPPEFAAVAVEYAEPLEVLRKAKVKPSQVNTDAEQLRRLGRSAEDWGKDVEPRQTKI